MMWNVRRFLILAGGACLLALGIGFVVFASAASRVSQTPVRRADGIVVLTGAQARIAEAGELLKQRKARRLLISGVNRAASRDEVRRQTGLAPDLFDCCVDVGYEAQDTAGNAEEARAWLDSNRFKSLIVVTSNYHMPRSLTELGRTLPDTVLIPYAVAPRPTRAEGWWHYAATMRVLASEYLKFLPSAARLTLARAIRSLESRQGAAAATTENASAK
jgi:uncharacterized SAM-binding protein YcdF (DUF218 family)